MAEQGDNKSDAAQGVPGDELSASEKETLIDWLCRRCDDRLNDDERANLSKWLSGSKGARAEYLQFYSLHAGLGSLVGGGTEDDAALKSTVRPTFLVWVSKSHRLVLTLAAVALIAVSLTWENAGFWGGAPPRERQDYLAAIAGHDDAAWRLTHVGGEREERTLMVAGDALTVEQGEATVRFLSGVELRLEQGARLVIPSVGACELTNGALRARVPPGAEGFVVHTPYGKVVDLGTEFGVRVDEQVDVHVFDGEVELTPSPFTRVNPQKRLTPILIHEGEGGSLLPAGAEPFARFVERNVEGAFPDARSAAYHPPGATFLAIEPFSQGRTGARALDRTGGIGWSSAWQNDRVESSSVSFLVSGGRLMSRGSGDGAIQRRLENAVTSLNKIYFSAEFEMTGGDPVCSAWLELYKHDEQRWSNGETDLAAIGITDGQLSGRLAPWVSKQAEKTIGDIRRSREGRSQLVVGRLEFDLDGEQDRLSIWIDPTLDAESRPDKVMHKKALYDRVDSIAVRCWEMDGAIAFVDNVRVSDSWRLVVE